MSKEKTKTQIPPDNGPVELSPLPPGVTRGLVERPNQNWGIDISTPMDRCPTNLNLASPGGRALLVAATQLKDYEFGASNRVIIKAHHYLCYCEERENDDGSVSTVRVCVLFDVDGKMFKSTGVYASNALRAAAFAYSPQDWLDGVTFVVERRVNPTSGRVIHDVRVLIDAEDAIGPPSKPTK